MYKNAWCSQTDVNDVETVLEVVVYGRRWKKFQILGEQ